MDASGTSYVDPDKAETTWCAYAWPVSSGSGNRTFFVNQNGDVLATDSEAYRGESGPRAGAAFYTGGLTSISGKTAVDRRGQDGQDWKQVN